MDPKPRRVSARRTGDLFGHPRSAALKRLRILSYVLDSAIRLPGGYRLGLDPIIGLIPGLGDTAGVMLSTYIIAEAARLGAPTLTLLRMVYNVALEALVGIVPVLGDLFDVAWKANARNVALLETHLRTAPTRTGSPRRLLWLVFGLLALVLIGVMVLAYLVIKLIAALF